MIINNKILDIISFEEIKEEDVHIIGCLIETINLMAVEMCARITIENSIVKNLNIHSCWFKKGFVLINNHIDNYIDYQMGGHNIEPIIIQNNIFNDFFNFFDCQFISDVIVKNNIFLKGTNLVGNVDEGFKNSFDAKLIVEGNVGQLDVDGINS